MKDYIVVLGSGISINSLSDEEREFIDSRKVKIAINKYAAFYQKARIVPTHIYFTDDYYESSRNFFEYMINFLNKERVPNLTFIVSKSMFPMLAKNKSQYLQKKFKNLIKDLKEIFLNLYKSSKKRTSHKINTLKLPLDSKIQSVEIVSHIKKGTPWAKKLEEPLYHFKGSLSSVLNYISIFYSNKKVLLVGVDFNTSSYFFEEELSELKFQTKDWTSELSKNENKHYSIIRTNGVKMDDEIPFMITELKKRQIELLSINKNSYLVEQDFVKYIDLNKLI